MNTTPKPNATKNSKGELVGPPPPPLPVDVGAAAALAVGGVFKLICEVVEVISKDDRQLVAANSQECGEHTESPDM